METLAAGELVARIVDHAGGAERWDSLSELRLRLRCSGLAFRTMRKTAEVAEMELVVQVHEPRTELRSVSVPGWRGRFDSGTTTLLAADGSALQSRENAVTRRREPWPASPWDDLAAMTFCSYAAWNYATFPVLLRRPDVRCDALGEHSVDGERLHGLRLQFPASVPTHAPAQTFWVTDEGALRRHDYRAQMVSPLAKAANRCVHESGAFGVTLPDHRIVTPLLPLRRAAPGPVIVDVTIDVLSATER